MSLAQYLFLVKDTFIYFTFLAPSFYTHVDITFSVVGPDERPGHRRNEEKERRAEAAGGGWGSHAHECECNLHEVIVLGS
jgi:hypothetical protein